MTKAINDHIDKSRCPDIHGAALSLVSTTQVWEPKISITVSGTTRTMRGDYDSGGKVQHIWTGNFGSPGKWLPWVLAHEAAHYVHGVDEDTADRIGDSCLNFTI